MNLYFNHGDGKVSAARARWSPEWCDECADYLLDAWERMTAGGIVNEDGPGIYSLQDCDSTCRKERIK